MIHGMTPVEYDILIAKKYTAKVENAAKRGIVFDLSLSQFRQLFLRKRCAYLNIELTVKTSQAGGALPSNYATLERVDNKRGYTFDNVVVVSHEANNIKSVFENVNATVNVDAAIAMFARIKELKEKQKNS